jgi:hypothetical protein
VETIRRAEWLDGGRRATAALVRLEGGSLALRLDIWCGKPSAAFGPGACFGFRPHWYALPADMEAEALASFDLPAAAAAGAGECPFTAGELLNCLAADERAVPMAGRPVAA